MTNVPDSPAENPAPELRSELRSWCEAWKHCLQDVFTQVSGAASLQNAVFEISSQPLPAADSDVWYTVLAAGAAHGEVSLRLPAASATRLAQKLLGETGPAAEAMAAQPITPENKEALEELLRQVAGLASTTLASNLDGEVKLSLSAAAPSWSSDAIVCLQTGNEAGVSIAVEIRISPALAAALQPRIQPPPSFAPQNSVSPASSSSTPSAPSSSYDRLMDVGLDVKLRFGTRRMLLREVLALSPGVVVELDNTLHSPVDLLLDGRLIAHGDVVVVDGKYGLRVTTVVDSTPPPG
ncbi:MAG: flagellar motor switch protein FliN [Terriglobales bacterium]|jgi:flagellar motor switch protein FliN/FliY